MCIESKENLKIVKTHNTLLMHKIGNIRHYKYSTKVVLRFFSDSWGIFNLNVQLYLLKMYSLKGMESKM